MRGKPNITSHKWGTKEQMIGVAPGGRVFVYKDRLYRFVQNTNRSAGDSLDVYEVTTLSTDYKLQEVLVPEFRQNFRGHENIDVWNSGRYFFFLFIYCN